MKHFTVLKQNERQFFFTAEIAENAEKKTPAKG
jgi:hypothetical protein